MASAVELRARLDFWQTALKKLREAYLALVDGGVKSYMIDDRQLTRFDLPALEKQIEEGRIGRALEWSEAPTGFWCDSERLVTG